MNADDEKVYRSGDDNLPQDAVTKKSLRDYYDRFFEHSDFEYYDAETSRKSLRAILKKAGLRTTPKQIRSSWILDVGCGTGFYSELMRELGFYVVGIDISEVGIAKGHEKYPVLSFVVCDSAAMPFKTDTFDAVFVSGCSLTNTRDLGAIQSYISYLSGFAKSGVVLFLGRSDLSGETASGSEWIYHRYDEVLQFVDRSKCHVNGPYLTNFRLVARLGAISINRIFSGIVRRLPGRRRWTVVYILSKKSA